MIGSIDNFLNNITMYRLVLYFLLLLLGVATVFSGLGFLPFGPLELIISIIVLMAVCWVTNKLLASILKVVVNVESAYITALILALIITPAISIQGLEFLVLAGVSAMASKFILAIRKKHLFNPAAVALFITSVVSVGDASWWVGRLPMVVFVLLGGLLLVRKIKRFDLVLSFLTVSAIVILMSATWRGNNPVALLQNTLLQSPLLFFAFVMLTEPQTDPPSRKLRILYGGLVGLGVNFFAPEMALVLGNIFSYLVSPKQRLVLKLQQKIEIGPDIYSFLFKSDRKLKFEAGQYLEWTLPHQNSDIRGVRRFFTVASSPTEEKVGIGVKFSQNGSSLKRKLLSMKTGDTIIASGLAGDFTLPKDPDKKLVFIAGGIGITPFRSMIKYLMDINQRRNIVLFYAGKEAKEFVFRDVFDRARKIIGLKVVYVTGILDSERIKKELPDIKHRIFYISGPHSMVEVFENVLPNLGVPKSQIKTDYFPGYA